ncbi:MAG: hypothetical protein EA353_00075, partial [Puniceicoccaceae bacterium]
DAELDVLVTGLSSLTDTWRNRAQGRFLVQPAEDYELRVFMTRPRLPRDHPFVQELGNLYGFPGGHHRHWEFVQADAIMRVTVRIDWSEAGAGQLVEVPRPHGIEDFSADPSILDDLDFPLVDVFGQMRSKDWPGKVTSKDELREDGAADRAFAAAATVGAERSPYGGYAGGPRLDATGFFRVEQIDGKWWFVDPDGYLFWSVGGNSMARGGVTRVTGRERLFPEGFSGDVNAYIDNLKVKYGESDWESAHTDVTLGRMLDWGMNTVGAWSAPELGAAEKVPYTLIVHTFKDGIGDVGKIPDPYSDRFRQSLHENLNRLAGDHAESPWLLGVFIHNELEWKGGIELSEKSLAGPPNSPARQAAIAYLRERYENIGLLNEAWGTDFENFDAIRPGTSTRDAYSEDLTEIMENFAAKYFQVCRDAMREFFPNHLYLGGRFNNFHPIVTRAASRYCDVVSANLYHYDVSAFSMATDESRPLLIGEFHFGIGDFGHWGRGLRAAKDARNQADLFRAYMGDALRHPNMVGAHWFAWSDQAVTGRFDGENFGVGLVSIVDRPHTKLIEALRETSTDAYRIRLGK